MNLEEMKTKPYGWQLAQMITELNITDEAEINALWAWWETTGKHEYIKIKSKLDDPNIPINNRADILAETKKIIQEQLNSLN